MSWIIGTAVVVAALSVLIASLLGFEWLVENHPEAMGWTLAVFLVLVLGCVVGVLFER